MGLSNFVMYIYYSIRLSGEIGMWLALFLIVILIYNQSLNIWPLSKNIINFEVSVEPLNINYFQKNFWCGFATYSG